MSRPSVSKKVLDHNTWNNEHNIIDFKMNPTPLNMPNQNMSNKFQSNAFQHEPRNFMSPPFSNMSQRYSGPNSNFISQPYFRDDSDFMSRRYSGPNSEYSSRPYSRDNSDFMSRPYSRDDSDFMFQSYSGPNHRASSLGKSYTDDDLDRRIKKFLKKESLSKKNEDNYYFNSHHNKHSKDFESYPLKSNNREDLPSYLKRPASYQTHEHPRHSEFASKTSYRPGHMERDNYETESRDFDEFSNPSKRPDFEMDSKYHVNRELDKIKEALERKKKLSAEWTNW